MAESTAVSYARRVGGFSAVVDIARINLESTLSTYGDEIPDAVADSIKETIAKLKQAQSKYWH